MYREPCIRMIQGLGATLNVMALLLVNMIGYAVGIRGAGQLAGGIFLDKEGLLAVAYGFMFLFSGVQASEWVALFFQAKTPELGPKRRHNGDGMLLEG